MADPRDGSLFGSAALIEKLQALGALDGGNIAIGAAKAGMKPALDMAATKIPVGHREHKTYKGNTVGPGFARRSLRIVGTRKSNSGLPSALLSTRKEAYYAPQFLERGAPKHKGPIKAQPWLVSAFYNSRDAQNRAIVAYLQKRVDKLLKTGTP